MQIGNKMKFMCARSKQNIYNISDNMVTIAVGFLSKLPFWQN